MCVCVSVFVFVCVCVFVCLCVSVPSNIPESVKKKDRKKMSGDGPGMMSDAYFVGRRQLLEFVNGFLDLDFRKVEQMHTGWAFCQV